MSTLSWVSQTLSFDVTECVLLSRSPDEEAEAREIREWLRDVGRVQPR